MHVYFEDRKISFLQIKLPTYTYQSEAKNTMFHSMCVAYFSFVTFFIFRSSICKNRTKIGSKMDISCPFGRKGTYNIDLQSRSNSVAPYFGSSVNSRATSFGLSFPSTSSTAYMRLEMQQQMEWYLLPRGHGFLGTHMWPGHVYLLVHGDMDSSRYDTHPGEKTAHILSFQALRRSCTSQKRLCMVEECPSLNI